MPKYNNLSILRKIDQHDLRSLRRIMTGLNHSLEVSKQLLNAKEGTSMYLTAAERTWVNRILNAITVNGDDYTLLKDAIKRFVEARLAPDKYVIEVTKELDQVAEEDVLVVPVSHIKEYEAALNHFHALPALKVPERRQPVNESQFLAPGGSSQVSSFTISGRTINDALLVKVADGVSEDRERLRVENCAFNSC